MKKITEKLRLYPRACARMTVEDIDCIADAIEHELEECYVELPKDFDGEYIHIGEAMEDADGPLGCVWLIGLNDVMFDDHTVRWPYRLRKVECEHGEQAHDRDTGWIELPKDADGEHVHIGDVMAYADNTKPKEVIALVPPAVFLTEDGPRYADLCRHYRPDSWERIWEDYVNLGDALTMDKEDVQSLLERAQKLGGEK